MGLPAPPANGGGGAREQRFSLAFVIPAYAGIQQVSRPSLYLDTGFRRCDE
jgi:hypothetical protein